MLAIADRFVIESTLGVGGMGTVYRAQDSLRGATVALKALNWVDPTTLLRFKNEFRALTDLSHPNLLQLYELVHVGDQYLLSMELVQGRDFLAYVRSQGDAIFATEGDGATESVPDISVTNDERSTSARQGPSVRLGALDEAKLRDGLRQLSEGLRALHDSGRLHRDLKPANVLVFQADGRVVICDFGLVEGVARPKSSNDNARLVDGISHTTTTTHDDMICGTLAFMSPEQACGQVLTPASDWYSVGVMLYQALTLRVPFDPHLEWKDAVKAKREVEPPHPLTIAPDAPPDLAELALALLNADPEQRAGFDEVIATVTGKRVQRDVRADLPELLIGREACLKQLDDALEKAAAGAAMLANVCGMSGMGKSALVRRFLESAAAAGALVFQSRCYEREDLPHKAVDPLMDALSQWLISHPDQASLPELIPPDAVYLRRLFPVLARVPCIADVVGGAEVQDPILQKRRAAAAFKTICHRLAARHPIVLYVDDLQWGDSDSNAFFMELMRGQDAAPVLLLFAYRAENENTSEVLKSLRSHLATTLSAEQLVDVRVEALSGEDARRLADALLIGAGVDIARIETIVEEAQGSPFFLRELCAYARTRRARRGPLRLATVISDRVRSLPRSGRALLECIAVSGRPELWRVVERASGIGAQVLSAGQVLKAHHLVQSTGTDEWARVEAAHDRIRETVVAAMSEERRQELHRMLAASLEQIAVERAQPRDVEALLRHYSGAGELQRAAHCAVEAAEHAERALAFGHAARLYQQALELSPGAPSEQSRLHERRGRALMFAGHGVAAADAFLEAMPGAAPERALELRREALTQLLRAGELQRGFEGLMAAEDVFGLRFPRSNFAAIVRMLWRKLRIRLDDAHLPPPGAPPCPEHITRQLDNLHRVSLALSSIEFLRGAVYTSELTLRTLRAGDPRLVSLALSIEALRSASGANKPERTRWIIQRGRELAERTGDRYVTGVIDGCAGVASYLEGRFEEGIENLRESTRIHREELHSRHAWDLVVDLVFELRAHAQVGRVHEIVARVPEAIRDAEVRGDTYALTMLRLGRLSWAFLGKDEPEVAREEMLTAERIWLQAPYQLFHYYALQSFVDISLYQDEPEAAFERLQREWRPMLLVRKIQLCRVEAHYMRARLALCLAAKHGDKKLLKQVRRDADALAKESAPWARAIAEMLHALLVSFDAREAASPRLVQAAEALQQSDMHLLAACARTRAGESSGDAALCDASRAAIAALGVNCPEKFVRMLAPGAGRRL